MLRLKAERRSLSKVSGASAKTSRAPRQPLSEAFAWGIFIALVVLIEVAFCAACWIVWPVAP